MPSGGPRPNTGGVRPGAGRPKKSENRYKKDNLAVLIARGLPAPLEILLGVMTDPTADLDIRTRAAAAAAPYIHRKQPVAMEVSGQFEHVRRVISATRLPMPGDPADARN